MQSQLEKTLEKMRARKNDLSDQLETQTFNSGNFFGNESSLKLINDINALRKAIRALEEYRNGIQDLLNKYSANTNYWNAHFDALESMLKEIESKNPKTYTFSHADFKLNAPTDIDYVVTKLDTYENVLQFTAWGAYFGAGVGGCVATALLITAAVVSTGPFLPVGFAAVMGALTLMMIGIAFAAFIGAVIGAPLGALEGFFYNEPNSFYQKDQDIENCEMLRSIKDGYGALISAPSYKHEAINDEDRRLEQASVIQ